MGPRRSPLGATVLATLALAAAALAAGSHGYRGPKRNGVFDETHLMTQWPEGGPMLLWRYNNLGNSWAAVAVTEDTVYAVGGGSVGRLYAFTLDGRLKWRRRYGREFSVRYQGSRATPTVSGSCVVVTSGLGVVYCMDAETGKLRWSVDTIERFQCKVPGWGYNLTPLVVDQKVILPIRRGASTMAALDLRTGKTIWANEPSEYAIGDSSPVLVEHDRTRLVVNNLWHALIAVDPDTGKIVWKLEGKDEAGTSLTPVFNEGYLLADYARKTVMFRPTPDGKGFRRLWQIPRIFSTAQAVILDGKVFAFGRPMSPTGRRKGRGYAFLCYHAETGKLMQSVPCEGAPGSVVAADGRVYWQEDGPKITLTRPTPEGFRVVGSFRPDFGDKEMWIHPVIAQGRLFLRSDVAQGGDQARCAGKLAVYDLREAGAEKRRERRARIRALVQALKAAEPSARAAAADKLLEMGWQARPAVPDLLAALRDPAPAVREKAAAALARVGAEAVPGLIHALQDDRVWRESHAAKALVRATGGTADPAAALLDAAEADAAVREEAAALLARIGASAAPAVTKLLASDDRRVRWWAIGVLMEYGPGAKPATAELIRIARTGNQWFQAKAAQALGRIGPDARAAVPVLAAMLKHTWPDARAAAAEALAGIGQKTPDVLDALRAAAKDKDAKASAAAARALKKLQP
jgi:outer membrane protein assembly factor BamB